MQALLTRSPSTRNGTFGLFSLDGRPVCVTCELPWKDNQPDVSCVPRGTYACVRHVSARFPKGNTWELQGVPGRSSILIHSANDVAQLEGCIAVGDSFGTVNSLPAVLNSEQTLVKLNILLPETFTLTITGGY